MLITLTLAVLFLGTSFVLWYRVSEKLPQLIAIQDQVITQRLHEDSAKFRVFLLHLKTFYKETYYRNLFWKFLGKIYYRLHIILLRFDNLIVRQLQSIRAKGGFSVNAQPIPLLEPEKRQQQQEPPTMAQPTNYYWQILKDHQASSSPASVVTVPVTIHAPIQEPVVMAVSAPALSSVPVRSSRASRASKRAGGEARLARTRKASNREKTLASRISEKS